MPKDKGKPLGDHVRFTKLTFRPYLSGVDLINQQAIQEVHREVYVRSNGRVSHRISLRRECTRGTCFLVSTSSTEVIEAMEGCTDFKSTFLNQGSIIGAEMGRNWS